MADVITLQDQIIVQHPSARIQLNEYFQNGDMIQFQGTLTRNGATTQIGSTVQYTVSNVNDSNVLSIVITIDSTEITKDAIP
jgi:hypothetical protein